MCSCLSAHRRRTCSLSLSTLPPLCGCVPQPFWPEGLGINRGFMGALDCADLVRGASAVLLRPLGSPPATSEDFHDLLARREEVRSDSMRTRTQLPLHACGLLAQTRPLRSVGVRRASRAHTALCAHEATQWLQ